ncbi:MAG: hypothetical protein JRE57_01650 [Deltaproteobacteria bacterium]|nr:hypothetical protein [Deltaproteobacteria bacterium]
MKPVIAVLWILSIAVAVGLTRLADTDGGGSGPSLSFDEAFDEIDPLQRTYLIGRSLQDLSADRLPELLEALEVHRMGIENEEVRLVMIAWARFDPLGAYEWALEGPKNWRSTLTNQAMFAWAYHDGPGALRMLEGIEDPELKLRLRSAVVDGWMRSDDKEGATEYIANFPDMKRRGRLFFLFAGEIMMAKGPEGAMRWLETLPDDAPNQVKLGLFHHIAMMVTTEDPVIAAEWFYENRTRSFTEGALSGIARRWVQHHERPPAFEWLLAMDSDGLRAGERADAIADAFRSWMQIDPEAAQAWLLAQLPNPRLDSASKEAAKRLVPTDPDKALEWAARVNDDDERRTLLVRAGRRWREKDPEAFSAWLQENELPEEIRQKILAASKGPRANMRPKPAAAGKP